jgi:hypothetical protein
MKSQRPQKYNSNRNDLLKYAGMGTYILVSLGVAVFLGMKADQWIRLSFPLLIWLAPLITLGAFFYKVYKDTSKK